MVWTTVEIKLPLSIKSRRCGTVKVQGGESVKPDKQATLQPELDSLISGNSLVSPGTNSQLSRGGAYDEAQRRDREETTGGSWDEG